jgi:hypothetical protein
MITRDAIAIVLQPSAAGERAPISHVRAMREKRFRWACISADPDRDRLQKNCNHVFLNDIQMM